MDLENSILQAGMNKKQTKVYLTLLQLGVGTIQEIANKTAVKRTTTYSILDNLVEKKLVVMTQKGAHRQYFAEDPKRIPQILKDEKRKLEQQQEHLAQIVPELASIYNIHAVKPKIRFYEGIEGLKQVFEETLELGRGEETLAFSSAESIHKYLGDYVPDYLSRRVGKGISQRAIAEDSPEAREHQKNDKAELRETRLVSKEKFPFSNEINIFRNKVFIASYKDLIGMIIESGEVAKTQRAIFELAWVGAGNMKHEARIMNHEDEHLLAKVGQYGLILNEKGEVLVLQRATSKTWSLPGGRLDKGEEPKSALEREIQEETGLRCEIGEIVDSHILSDSYQVKYCVYFGAKPKGVYEIKLSDEHSSYRWCDKSAVKEIKFEDEKVREVVRRVFEVK